MHLKTIIWALGSFLGTGLVFISGFFQGKLCIFLKIKYTLSSYWFFQWKFRTLGFLFNLWVHCKLFFQFEIYFLSYFSFILLMVLFYLILLNSQIYQFFPYCTWILSHGRKVCPSPMWEENSFFFFPNRYMVSFLFTFKFLIHLNLCYCVWMKKRYNFIFFPCDLSFNPVLLTENANFFPFYMRLEARCTDLCTGGVWPDWPGGGDAGG